MNFAFIAFIAFIAFLAFIAFMAAMVAGEREGKREWADLQRVDPLSQNGYGDNDKSLCRTAELRGQRTLNRAVCDSTHIEPSLVVSVG